ncbi:3,4-dihydroxy-2-butanone-4-phosphate synthase [Conexibacter sp. CPCC 206217]|uniref:3,4-dihydroxy-2-butanone-4-phosphate synthase n=1 Tax=Conexibacter sp. CPCC 206217 TaxID=3064574 RepID=UPI002716A162|nr:3,4-dihydroxy-2-butanone-4-phosphate synthase [Conexibacter sp. CPCC 206217]MDO8212014.1 3,4-dihydroxy-2-butanone-4-phosphate synthase [Conexibacter sp. CPCC 206217]
MSFSAPDGAEALDPVDDAIDAIAGGGMAVVVDDPGRENEGDVLMAAEHVTAQAVNFMVRHARGLVCVPMERARLDALKVPAMVRSSGDRHGTAFHVGVDHARLATTGISAADRAAAIRALASTRTVAADLVRPGHVFPLAAREGGVLERPGHTEAAVDLARLAGCTPAGVICEIASEDGAMARLPELRRFADRHGLPLISIADLVAYRTARAPQLERAVETALPLPQGDFRIVGYRELLTGGEHVALVLGDFDDARSTLVRVHEHCFAGDVLGSPTCRCADRRRAALELIGAVGHGVLVYARARGSGDGTLAACPARGPRSAGDERWSVAAQILHDLGAGPITLLADGDHAGELQERGVRVVAETDLDDVTGRARVLA